MKNNNCFNENVDSKSSSNKLAKNFTFFRKNNKVTSEFYVTLNEFEKRWTTINELNLTNKLKKENEFGYEKNNLNSSFSQSFTTDLNMEFIYEQINNNKNINKKRRSRYESGYYSISNDICDSTQLTPTNLLTNNNFSNNLLFEKTLCLQTCCSSTTSINSISNSSHLENDKKLHNNLQQSLNKDNYNNLNLNSQNNTFLNEKFSKTNSNNLQINNNCFNKENCLTDYEEISNHLNRFKNYLSFIKSTELMEKKDQQKNDEEYYLNFNFQINQKNSQNTNILLKKSNNCSSKNILCFSNKLQNKVFNANEAHLQNR